MNLTVKKYDELTRDELFDIMQLRVSVFVVEQNCPYQEIDDADKLSYHITMADNGKILAYARVIPAGVIYKNISLGRVIAVERKKGYGTQIVKAAVETAKEKLNAECIEIEAQTYARKLYENLGFRQTSDEFFEDGIPHIKMELKL